MADPIDPSTPPSTEPPVGNPSGPSSTGLPSNVAAALACFPLIGGLIFWFVEKRDSFVRFYAMQSIIFGAAWLLFNIASGILHAILWSLPGVGGFFGSLWMFVAALIHLALFATLDLVGQAPGGPDEDPKGFPFGGWQAPLFDEVSGTQVGAAYEGTNAQLLGHMRHLHTVTKARYGAVKLWKALRSVGLRCGRHRVAR